MHHYINTYVCTHTERNSQDNHSFNYHPLLAHPFIHLGPNSCWKTGLWTLILHLWMALVCTYGLHIVQTNLTPRVHGKTHQLIWVTCLFASNIRLWIVGSMATCPATTCPLQTCPAITCPRDKLQFSNLSRNKLSPTATC
jgi:hypothetical protein